MTTKLSQKSPMSEANAEIFQNCIFCKIGKGEIPCKKVYEDKNYLAFLDIKPLNKGHVLVIPKKHFQWVYDVDDQGGYWKVAQKIARQIIAKMGARYVHFVTWGLEVPHAHIHVVPRYENDGHPGFIDWKNSKTIDDAEMQRIAERIAVRKK